MRKTKHTIEFIGDMGPKWDKIGWGLSIVVFIGMFLTPLVQVPPETAKIALKGIPEKPEFDSIRQYLHIAASSTPGFFYYVINIVENVAAAGLFAWLALDIIDKKANWMWLIPAVCFCCCFLNWIWVPFYILKARREPIENMETT